MKAQSQEVIIDHIGRDHGIPNRDRLGAHAVAFCVLHEGIDRVESHRLVVDEPTVKLRRAVDLEPAGSISNEGKGNGVGLRESIEREGADGGDDSLLNLEIHVSLGHAGFESTHDGIHAFVRPLKRHGLAQKIRFDPGESSNHHGHSEDLFLKEGDSESSLQYGFEIRVNVFNVFPPGAAIEVGMNQVPHDGSGADNGNLHRNVVELPWLHDGERGHLRPRLDLKGAYGVGPAEEVVSGRVVFWDLCEIDRAATTFADFQGILHRREHPEAEKVDFYDAQILTVIFVPLQHGSILHRGWLEGHDMVEPVITKDHASRVLPEMPRTVKNGMIEFEKWFEAGMGRGNSRSLDRSGELHDLVAGVIITH